MTSPNFFIIGAPKCGTTSLARWLGEHRRIFMCPLKEPHFFNSDMTNRQTDSMEKYLSFFRAATSEHKAVGEASVWYMYSKVALDNIMGEIPDARFIVCLRNPVEMAVSLYRQQIFALNEHLKDFEEAWRAQDARRDGRLISKYCVDGQELLYREACSLGSQLERVFEKVSADRVCLVFMDDLKKSPRAEYLRMLDFLGVPDDGRQDFKAHNVAQSNRYESVAKLMKSYRSFKQRLQLQEFGNVVTRAVGRLNTRRDKSAPVDHRFVQREVLPALLPEIDKLAEICGRDLSAYKTYPASR